jgi:hypothetical protein
MQLSFHFETQNMRHHKSLFKNVRRRTEMYVSKQTYAIVAAFVQGYDMAYEGGLLNGFKEWLVLRLQKGSNLGWPALVLDIAFPTVRNPEACLGTPESERLAIEMLFDLLAEFDIVREDRDGLRKILVAYEKWQANGAK